MLAPAGRAGGSRRGTVVARSVAWHLLADNLGVSTTTRVPVLELVLLAPIALALFNLAAAFPGRTAARTPAATALRSS